MPINIQNDLPAKEELESENIFVMSNMRASTQDIRPLKIVILNLMPIKMTTETQLLRLLGNTPLQVEIELLQTATYTSKHTPSSHLKTFYKTFEQIKDQQFDGMIITGAPVENLDYSQVTYWEELCEIMEWSKTNVYSTYHICWGAQAGLYYHYDVPKYMLDEKMSGVFLNKMLNPNHPLTRGFDDYFNMPHSRYSSVSRDEIEKNEELEILAISDMAGVSIVCNKSGRQVFVFGHGEYDRDTLSTEYFRDLNKGLNPNIPVNYFPKNDPQATPPLTWKSHSFLLFSNWLNYYLYQQTPYNLEDLKELYK